MELECYVRRKAESGQEKGDSEGKRVFPDEQGTRRYSDSSRLSASSNLPRFSSTGTIILSSDNPSTSFRTYITAPANFHNPRYFNSLCTTSKAVEAEEQETELVSPVVSRRSHPAQPGETFDGPPSLERSGSEHRVGRFPPSPLRVRGAG